ncbi:TPA: DUF465 domain-containing protein, partial [Campylobacter upsaliensis]|nr:DUF465 domain-containing protein [Campylobacter upsaliensis]
AEEGRAFLSDAEISTLKKEKLHVKDELAQYLANYKK